MGKEADVSKDCKVFIDSIKEQLLTSKEIIEKIEGGDLLEKTDDEKEGAVEHFLMLFWELFLSAQNLSLCGDLSALTVFMMLAVFTEISTGNVTNKDLLNFINNLISIQNEIEEDIEEEDADG